MTDSPATTTSLFGIVKRIGKFIKCLARIGFVIINNLYCIPTYVLWMVLLSPMKFYQPQIYFRIEGLFFHWLLAMVSTWAWTAGYDIVEQGDSIEGLINEKTLVIANHQSTGDVPMLMTTFNSKPGVLPNIMWIMDKVFKYTNFGIVSILHQDFFILSGRKNREQGRKQLRNHLLESYVPRDRKWIVLFPEGGFLCKRLETSQNFAKKQNLPLLEKVTLPRVGALQTIFDTLGPTSNNNSTDQQLGVRPNMNAAAKPEIGWILDITVAYPEGKPIDLPTIITGSRDPCETVLFYRVFPSSLVPREPELLTKWLFDRWVEKEALLDNFYKYGTFTGTQRPTSPEGSKIQQDPLRFLVLHLFFITSSYIHYNMIVYMLSYMWW